jgi:DNA-3-methyladenine glycosylase I
VAVDGALADGLVRGEDGVPRCWWGAADPVYRAYHDHEWGRPLTDDRALFELLVLETFQSGLSWITILRKRDGFRRAFDGFDAARVAGYDQADVARLLGDAAIVRNRAKVAAAITNARRYLELVADSGSLTAFVWGFEPPPASRPDPLDVVAMRALVTTPESRAMAKAFKRRGWAFVGPTVAYSLMQSAGVVNDHLEGCALRAEAEAERAAFARPT